MKGYIVLIFLIIESIVYMGLIGFLCYYFKSGWWALLLIFATRISTYQLIIKQLKEK